MCSSQHLCSGSKPEFVHCIYTTYIYNYIYIYISPTWQTIEKKAGCHFPFFSLNKKIQKSSLIFPSFSGWVQHFCCYTLALQRILDVVSLIDGSTPKRWIFRFWGDKPRRSWEWYLSPSILSSWYMKILGSFFHFEWGGWVVGGIWWIFGWVFCGSKSEDPYEATRRGNGSRRWS